MSILISDPKAGRPDRFQLWLVALIALALVVTLIIVPRAISAAESAPAPKTVPVTVNAVDG